MKRKRARSRFTTGATTSSIRPASRGDAAVFLLLLAGCQPSSASDPLAPLPPTLHLGELSVEDSRRMCVWSNQRAQRISISERAWCASYWREAGEESCREACARLPRSSPVATDLLDCERATPLFAHGCHEISVDEFGRCLDAMIGRAEHVMARASCDSDPRIDPTKLQLPGVCLEILGACPGAVPPEIVTAWLASGGDFTRLRHDELQAVYDERDAAHASLCVVLDRCYPRFVRDHGFHCTVETPSGPIGFDDLVGEDMREVNEQCLARAYLFEPEAIVLYGSCFADAYRKLTECFEEQACPASGMECLNAYRAQSADCDQPATDELSESLDWCNGWGLGRF